MSSSPVIVVGSGLAAWTVVRELRKRERGVAVTVICADAGDFYAKPSLSNALALGRTPAQLVTTPAATMAQTLGVTLLPYTRVTALQPEQHTVQTDAGALAYRSLVLATGAQAIRLAMQGEGSDQVLSVNSLADFSAFHARLKPGTRVALIGGGLIGCEFANDLVASGHAVQVIDPADRPLAALLPPEASAALRQALAARGTQWHLGTTVQTVDSDAAGRAWALRLANGETLVADLVLSAVGLRPDCTLAQAAGLYCERGVVVDAELQTSAPDVYALGDVAQYAQGLWRNDPQRGGRLLPYVMPIMAAAKALATTLTGTPTPVHFGLMPVAVKTPAYPLVVAAPAVGTPGAWQQVEADVWHFVGALNASVQGFVLGGAQTGRRAQMAKLLEE